jgi:murein L,D-transpeptidase YcbB/YkuD
MRSAQSPLILFALLSACASAPPSPLLQDAPTTNIASTTALPAEPPPESPSPWLFVDREGLKDAGETLARWASRAHLHGLDLPPFPDVSALSPDEADARLTTYLARLAAELRPAPRTTPILEDPSHSFYLSPDITWRGAPPRTLAPEALAPLLEAARNGSLDKALDALLPPHPQYRPLVEAAARYDALCKSGGWPMTTRPKLPKKRTKNWIPPPEIAAIFQNRLAIEGYFRPTSSAPLGHWDAETEKALSDFRADRQIPQKGLDEDDLYEALNVPCERRLASIVLNIKRWRHSAWQSEPTFVEVNIAAQELRFVRNHVEVMTQRTIVGATKWYFDKDLDRRINLKSTPILTDHISRIVINPTWAVPPRIAKKEIAAEVAKDPTYLEKNRITLVESPRGRTYIQAPGRDNALGLIKILFPNSESVYLHDTPKKGPFKLAVRALSHGCVRVQNAVDFGVALLSHDAETAGDPFNEAATRKRAGRGGTVNIDLKKEIPVFLEYYTASVTPEGRVRFHPDIYAYDEEVLGKPPKVTIR